MIHVREPLKRIVWHGDSLERIRSFPSDARQDAWYELERVQGDREPRDWKPMNAASVVSTSSSSHKNARMIFDMIPSDPLPAMTRSRK